MTETSPAILLIAAGGTIAAESYQGGPTPKYVTVLHNDRVIAEMKRLTQLTLSEALDGMAQGKFTATELTDAFLSNIAIQERGTKDSKDITDEDIHEWALAIKEAKEYPRVVVTCGTDQMAPIARKLKQELYDMGILNQRVVAFTGAMKPLSHGPEGSDGFQNLQDAYEVVRNMPPGVRMVIGRRIYNPDQTDKFLNPETNEGVFGRRW